MPPVFSRWRCGRSPQDSTPHSTPRSMTSRPQPSIIIFTRFLPMSCMSPFTVTKADPANGFATAAHQLWLQQFRGCRHTSGCHEHFGHKSFAGGKVIPKLRHSGYKTVVQEFALRRYPVPDPVRKVPVLFSSGRGIGPGTTGSAVRLLFLPELCF